MKKNKRIGIFFTGGLDSTYLVYKNLVEGNSVVLYYTILKNNVNKTKIELFTRDKLYNLFKVDFEKISYKDEYCLNEYNLKGFDNFDLLQIPIWIFDAVVNNLQNEVDEIQIGYIMNDCAISYLNEIKKVYNSFNKLTNKKLIPFTFPLSKISKSTIINLLPEKYLKEVWTCEIDNFNFSFNYNDLDKNLPCGKCVPCKNYERLVEDNYDKFRTKIPKLVKQIKEEYESDIIPSNKYSKNQIIESNENLITYDKENPVIIGNKLYSKDFPNDEIIEDELCTICNKKLLISEIKRGTCYNCKNKENVCYICANKDIMDGECEICNKFYCEEHKANYTIHNQIDFNCCKYCEEKRKEWQNNDV